MVSGLGKFRDDKAVQRWRHKLSVDWDYGPVGVTVTNNYMSGYNDQNTAGLAAAEWNDRDVKPYSLRDLTASYRITPALRLRAGVLNVADTAPPFTNQCAAPGSSGSTSTSRRCRTARRPPKPSTTAEDAGQR